MADQGVGTQQALDLAKANYETAKASVDASAANVTQARAQVSQKEAAVAVARTNLDYTVIRSPIDGIVVARNVDVGQTVAASLQAPTIFTIAQDLTKMLVYAKVDESDVGRIRMRQPVTFKVDAFPKDLFDGVVSQVRMNPTTVQNVVTYDAVIEFQNPDLKLFPGMTAYVTIPVATAENVVKIPNAALRYKPPMSAEAVRALYAKYGIDAGPPPGASPAASAGRPRRRGPRTAAPGARGERRRLEAPRRRHASSRCGSPSASPTTPTPRSTGRPRGHAQAGRRGRHELRDVEDPAPRRAGNPALTVPDADPVIRVDEVHKYYEMGETRVHALRGVSLSVERGGFVAIMGASGSGKSTFMNILGCLDRPTSGRYLLEGIDVSGLEKRELAAIRNRKLGFVFQGFNLLPAHDGAREHAASDALHEDRRRRSAPRRAREALALVGLAERAGHFPSQLSGGQQQRVAIARALVNRPSILLADEPTGNLDSRTSVEIMEILQDLNERGLTIVLVTHEHDIAQFAKRVVVFADGRIRKDEAVPDPPRARDVLKTLPTLED